MGRRRGVAWLGLVAHVLRSGALDREPETLQQGAERRLLNQHSALMASFPPGVPALPAAMSAGASMASLPPLTRLAPADASYPQPRLPAAGLPALSMLPPAATQSLPEQSMMVPPAAPPYSTTAYQPTYEQQLPVASSMLDGCSDTVGVLDFAGTALQGQTCAQATSYCDNIYFGDKVRETCPKTCGYTPTACNGAPTTVVTSVPAVVAVPAVIPTLTIAPNIPSLYPPTYQQPPPVPYVPAALPTPAYQPVAVSTTITALAPRGTTILAVVSQAGFNVGDSIQILDPTTNLQETNTVAGYGSLLLGAPLQNEYSAGSQVSKLAAAAVPQPSFVGQPIGYVPSGSWPVVQQYKKLDFHFSGCFAPTQRCSSARTALAAQGISVERCDVSTAVFYAPTAMPRGARAPSAMAVGGTRAPVLTSSGSCQTECQANATVCQAAGLVVTALKSMACTPGAAMVQCFSATATGGVFGAPPGTKLRGCTNATSCLEMRTRTPGAGGLPTGTVLTSCQISPVSGLEDYWAEEPHWAQASVSPSPTRLSPASLLSPTFGLRLTVYSTAILDSHVDGCVDKILRGEVVPSTTNVVSKVNWQGEWQARPVCGTWEVTQGHNCTTHEFCCVGHFCGTDNVASIPTRYQCLPCSWELNSKYTALGGYSGYACSRTVSHGIFTTASPTMPAAPASDVGVLPYPLTPVPSSPPPIMPALTIQQITQAPLTIVHTPSWNLPNCPNCPTGFLQEPGLQQAMPPLPVVSPGRLQPLPVVSPGSNDATPVPAIVGMPPPTDWSNGRNDWRTIGCNQDEILQLARTCSAETPTVLDPLTNIWDECPAVCKQAMKRQVETHGCCVSTVLGPALANAMTPLESMYKRCDVEDPCLKESWARDSVHQCRCTQSQGPDGCESADCDIERGEKCFLQATWGINYRVCAVPTPAPILVAAPERCANTTAVLDTKLANVLLACNGTATCVSDSDCARQFVEVSFCLGHTPFRTADGRTVSYASDWLAALQADPRLSRIAMACGIEPALFLTDAPRPALWTLVPRVASDGEWRRPPRWLWAAVGLLFVAGLR